MKFAILENELQAGWDQDPEALAIPEESINLRSQSNGGVGYS